MNAVNVPGVGTGHLFVTLAPTTPTASVASSMGLMTITSGSPGTFSSTLNLNLDIYLGSLTGTFLTSTSLTLTSSGDSWSHTNTTPWAVLIPGVNYELNGGTDTSADFWPGVPLMEDSSGAAHHYVDPGGTTTIPEPSSWVLGAIAVVIGMAGAGWCRRRAA